MSSLKKNIFQRFKLVYGLNRSLIKLLMKHAGYHVAYPVSSIRNTYVSDGLAKLLVSKENFLSAALAKTTKESVILKLKSKTYHGFMLRNELPVRGQRRRTNANTIKHFVRRLKISS
uniref:Ribosomal protein S13 n=1 Tax=Stachyamoeba lipophora TaxID=463046 RepID=A0A0B5GFZ6_STALP|nr:ribosomal protein S13 [Stachyamoeba lipophora]AJF22932.1 ribosomal protein S13 [Stachyamoeba lipophora]